MENRMLYCYKEWLEGRDGNIFKQISKLPVMGIILLVLLFCGLMGFWALLANSVDEKNNQTATLVLSVVYVALGIITSIYCERYQVKHSKQGMEDYKKYCDDMMEKF